MSNMEFALYRIWVSALLIFSILLSAVFWMWLLALVTQYSLEDQHFRVKVFGVFRIISIPYHEIKEVQVVPWWRILVKDNWGDYFSTLHWSGYEFQRTRVLITTSRSWFRYTVIAPVDSATFAAALSARIPKIM